MKTACISHSSDSSHVNSDSVAQRRGRPLVQQWLLSSAVVALCFCARPVGAQVVTGTITGVVSDDSRAALPDVTIRVTSLALPGGPVASVTNAQGAYRFSTLARFDQLLSRAKEYFERS